MTQNKLYVQCDTKQLKRTFEVILSVLIYYSEGKTISKKTLIN